MSDITLEDLNTNVLDLDSNMKQLQDAFNKAMQTTVNADVIMPVEYDPEIKKRISQQTPFLEFLKSQGCVKPTDKVKVGYKLKTNNTKTNFMYESEGIKEATPSDFDERIAKMKILHYPISIGDIAESAAEFDLFNDESNDAAIDMANTLDYTLLEGEGTEDSKDFRGIFNTIRTNTFNLGGDLLTKDDITSGFEAILEEGGYPAGIVCTSEIASQINDIYFPGTVKPLEYELTAGYNVVGIISTAGNRVPIIVDRWIDRTKGEKLAIVDSSSIKVRELQGPTMVPWAKTKLSNDVSLVQVITAYMDAEHHNCIINNVGKDEDRKTKTRMGNVSFKVIGTDGKPVSGVKVQFTNEDDDVFKSGATNNRGISEMIQVPFDTYSVSYDAVPSGYTVLPAADYEVKSADADVQLVLTKN